MFYRILLMSLFFQAIFSGTVKASYVAQTLKEQVESSDQVAHVQIVSGKLHQFTHEYSVIQNPKISI